MYKAGNTLIIIRRRYIPLRRSCLQRLNSDRHVYVAVTMATVLVALLYIGRRGQRLIGNAAKGRNIHPRYCTALLLYLTFVERPRTRIDNTRRLGKHEDTYE